MRVGNKFLVLETPDYVSSPSMEVILGDFSEPNIRNYKITEFNTLQDAQDRAFMFPPISWNKLVSIHEDAYRTIQNAVKRNLERGNYIVELDSHLMDPTELKEMMFRRVSNFGERFTLFYDANDIICINIINPWTANLVEIAHILETDPELRIKKMIRTKTHISLIGETDVGTMYEIRLWTTLMAQWAKWIHMNKLDPRVYVNMLAQIQSKQDVIDGGYIVR